MKSDELRRRFVRAEAFLTQAIAPFEMSERTAALRASEERLARAQRLAEIGSWELDLATGRYFWSKEMYRLRGMTATADAPTMAEFLEDIRAEDRARVVNWYDRLEAGVEAEGIIFHLRRGDGEIRIVAAEGEPVVDEQGRVVKLAGALRDVTQSKATERLLIQAQKMEAVGNLTGGLAHDFNNLLGVIIGNLDLLCEQAKSDAAIGELARDALDAALHGADLTRRLLAFARRQPLQPQRVEVNQLVMGITKLLSRTLGENIEVESKLAAELWSVIVDPAQLEAAITNLATNARDAMPKGGRLIVATYNKQLDADYCARHQDLAPGDYAVVEVSDSGIGMMPETMQRIYEPFFTTKEVGKGTGLGLSMVFGFIKQSGGHINVNSEPGHGTTFQLYLPAAAAAAPRRPAENEPQATMHGDGETVLVVEDNAKMRGIVVKQLVELGYRVLQAESAKAALQSLDVEAKIDLLFSDVVMPGAIDGFELATEAGKRQPGLKVLLTSGFPEARLREQVPRLAGLRLLSKPYRKAELARATREALDEPVRLDRAERD